MFREELTFLSLRSALLQGQASKLGTSFWDTRYLSHAMLSQADLIVCSMEGFACILANWFWPTEMSLSLTYECLEVL